MMRLAITRVEEGEREVPVATSFRDVLVESGLVARLKKRAGTEPHVKGPMKLAIAEPPGWRNLSNL
jgi:hypothetical protein